MKLPEKTDSETQNLLKDFEIAKDQCLLDFTVLIHMCHKNPALLLKVLDTLKSLFFFLAKDKMKMNEKEWNSQVSHLKEVFNREKEMKKNKEN